MLQLVIGAVTGYVLGTRAGRARYEQIVKATQAIAQSPATKKALAASRKQLARTLDPHPKLEPIEAIDETTTILIPQEQMRRTSLSDKD